MIIEFTGTRELDARVWARNFCKKHPTIDEGTMIGWFANAIMAGHDVATAEKDNEIRRIEMERDDALVNLERLKLRALRLVQEKRSLEDVLGWYKERVEVCNRRGPEGDEAREELARDGGYRAREAMSVERSMRIAGGER